MIRINLDRYLKRLGFRDYEKPEPNRWVVQVPIDTPDLEEFTIDIFLSDGWLSLTSIIMENLTGNNLVHFYELLFRINHFFNDLKMSIDMEGTYLAIQLEISIFDIDTERLHQVFHHFATFYVYWFPKLMEIIDNYDLKFRTPTKRKRIADKMLQKINVNMISKFLIKYSPF